MAQQLRALAVLPEVLSSNPGTLMSAQNCLQLQVQRIWHLQTPMGIKKFKKKKKTSRKGRWVGQLQRYWELPDSGHRQLCVCTYALCETWMHIQQCTTPYIQEVHFLYQSYLTSLMVPTSKMYRISCVSLSFTFAGFFFFFVCFCLLPFCVFCRNSVLLLKYRFLWIYMTVSANSFYSKMQ